VGEVAGLPTMFTQQLSALTPGTRAAAGAAQVDGANQNVNYKDVAISATTNGNYMSATMNVKGLTAAHTVKDGEVFTIGATPCLRGTIVSSKSRATINSSSE
jgi:hypothetical protein